MTSEEKTNQRIEALERELSTAEQWLNIYEGQYLRAKEGIDRWAPKVQRLQNRLRELRKV